MAAWIDDSAYIAAATKQASSVVQSAVVWTAIQVALMTWQRWSKGQIADIRQQQADRRMIMAEEVRAHAALFEAEELDFVNDTMAMTKATPLYSLANASAAVADVEESLAIDTLTAAATRIGASVSACDNRRIARNMALVRTDGMAHQMRSQEARAQSLNDRRFSRQLAVLGLGRGKLRDAFTAGSLSAGRMAVRDVLVNSINSGMQLWGYMDTRWQHDGRWSASQPGSAAYSMPGGKLWTPGPTGNEYQPTSLTVVAAPQSEGSN